MSVDVISLPTMADLTAINVDANKKDVDYLIEVARAYSFASTFTPPYYTSYVREHLEGSGVLTGAVVGFPSGAEVTPVKVFAAKDRIAAGAQEVDIVMNVGEFKSGNLGYVADDIKAVADVCNENNVALKVIIETAFLNNDEILRAGEIVAGSGATFIKSSTGLWGKATTVEMVKLMKKAVGDKVLIKAAGGIRTVETMQEMIESGASRFGIGCLSCVDILRKVDIAAGKEGRIDEILEKYGLK